MWDHARQGVLHPLEYRSAEFKILAIARSAREANFGGFRPDFRPSHGRDSSRLPLGGAPRPRSQIFALVRPRKSRFWRLRDPEPQNLKFGGPVTARNVHQQGLLCRKRWRVPAGQQVPGNAAMFRRRDLVAPTETGTAVVDAKPTKKNDLVLPATRRASTGRSHPRCPRSSAHLQCNVRHVFLVNPLFVRPQTD